MSTADVGRVHRIERIAREAFGWPALRPGQLDAIQTVLDGRDLLVVMPTGHGKSAIYQLAAALIAGPTVIVSPLIALQADQVAGLNARPGAPDAVAINSAQSDRENAAAWDAVEAHGTTTGTAGAEYLFLAPEQLAKDEVVDRLRAVGVALFVVDEAHCVAAWGHDFRPDYLRLGEVIERLEHPTVLALTATGSPPVRKEIVERLHLHDARVITRGFDRPNISLGVVRHSGDADKRAAVIEQVLVRPAPGLVYVATRGDTERYAAELRGAGLRAAAYHGGLPASARRAVHEGFRRDGLDVVVATSAFGMGIDKPNVRFVVHAAITDSLDSYYQEIGRAGRDGQPATATLHYRSEDLGLRRFFAAGAPAPGDLRGVVSALLEAGAPLRPAELAGRLGVSARSLSRLTNLLEQAGVVVAGARGIGMPFAIDPDAAAALAVDLAETRERVDQSRIAMMRGYAETDQCRRQVLLGYFGEDLEEPCGNCDTCASGSALEQDAGEQDAGKRGAGKQDAGERGAGKQDAGERGAGKQDAGKRGAGERVPDASVQDPYPVRCLVSHRDWGSGTVMRAEADRITVYFESEGYKVLSLEAVDAGGLLERTG